MSEKSTLGLDMNERTVCISIATLFGGDHNHPDIPDFLREFAAAIYAGEGKKPKFMAALDIAADFPLRMMIGVPADSLTRSQRLLAETGISLVLGRHLGDTYNLWATGSGWQPTNPRRVSAPVTESRLDQDWALSLGVARSIWEQDVLLGQAMAPAATNNRATAVMRQLLALGAYGFADPYQFFTAAHQ